MKDVLTDERGRAVAWWPLLDARLGPALRLNESQIRECAMLQEIRADAWESVVQCCLDVEAGDARGAKRMVWCAQEAVRLAVLRVRA